LQYDYIFTKSFLLAVTVLVLPSTDFLPGLQKEVLKPEHCCCLQVVLTNCTANFALVRVINILYDCEIKLLTVVFFHFISNFCTVKCKTYKTIKN